MKSESYGLLEESLDKHYEEVTAIMRMEGGSSLANYLDSLNNTYYENFERALYNVEKIQKQYNNNN